MFQTEQLIIVGGPSAVGKSTLIALMQQGHLPGLCEQLDVTLTSSTLYLEARELPQVQQASVAQLVLHYDFLQQSLPDGDFAYLFDLISRSHRVTALTMYTSSDILFQRMSARMRKTLISFLPRPNRNKTRRLINLWKRRKLYKNASNLTALYYDWSVYMDKRGVTNHLMLDSAESDTAVTRPHERTEVARILNGKSGRDEQQERVISGV